MTALFADAFYFLAMLNPRDAWHAEANQFSGQNHVPILTTTWVLVEVGNGLSRSVDRAAVGKLVARLRRDSLTTIIAASDEWFQKGLTLYSSRLDKEWSLVDCISFVVMQELGITEALTGDHHFEQAGFQIVFK